MAIDSSWVNWDNEEKLTVEDAKFIFEQAEKLLKDINETNALIVSRTTTLITIVVGFMIALIGFIFNRAASAETFSDAQLLTAGITLLYIFNLCWRLVKNIQPKD